MNTYLLLKTLHILSSVLLVGTHVSARVQVVNYGGTWPPAAAFDQDHLLPLPLRRGFDRHPLDCGRNPG